MKNSGLNETINDRDNTLGFQMDSTTALTGLWPAVIILAAVLTLVVSAFLLWLYRRVTIGSMNRRAMPDRTVPVEPDLAIPSSEVQLNITVLRDDSDTDDSSFALKRYRQASLSSRSTAIAICLGGSVYALILATVWVYLSGGISIGKFLWLFTVFMWPTVIAMNLLITVSKREIVLLFLAYSLIILLTGSFVLLNSDQSTISQLIGYWLIVNLPATVLFGAFLQRRIRSVGPLVFSFMLAGVAGALLLIQVLGGSDAALYLASSAGSALGLGATGVLLSIALAGFLVFALVGWFLLKLIGINYQRKNLSDQSITLDSLFLMFGIVQTVSLAFEGIGWILTGPIAFLGYKIASSAVFAFSARSSDEQKHPSRLLLLRVFALGPISNLWFYRFSKLWRHAGSVNLIAGPDLVTSAIEPHEFLSFLAGDLSRQFVKGDDDLTSRVNGLDYKPDPDNRYRVNEFFCHDDTWRNTLKSLVSESESVLMDLRSFSVANDGCLYELGVLLNSVDFRCVVFLIDDTTDVPFLDQSLRTLCKRISNDSPNARHNAVHARFYHSNRPTRHSIRKLMLLLLASGDNQTRVNTAPLTPTASTPAHAQSHSFPKPATNNHPPT